MQEGKDCLLMALAPASRKKPLQMKRLFSLAAHSLLIAPGRSPDGNKCCTYWYIVYIQDKETK